MTMNFKATFYFYYVAITVEQEDSIILKMGDKVKVNLTVTAFQQLQDNTINGGWNDGMEQVSALSSLFKGIHACFIQLRKHNFDYFLAFNLLHIKCITRTYRLLNDF